MVIINGNPSFFRKKRLISPDELELPWRPLYEIMAHHLHRNPIGIYRNLSWCKTLLHCVIYSIKIYFPVRMIFLFKKKKTFPDSVYD